MGEGYEMMRMGVECGLMRGMGGDEIVVDGEMGGELAGGEDRTAGYNNIMLSVGEDADDRPIIHRRTSQIAHTTATPFAVEMAADEMGYGESDGGRRGEWRQLTVFGIGIGGEQGYHISTVAFGPLALP